MATIATIQEERLLENAGSRGEQLMVGLRHLQEEYPAIGDVRGLGLMVGVELSGEDRAPDKAMAKRVIHACQEEKLLLLTCGPWDNTIRFIPPLVASAEEIGEALRIFEGALQTAAG